MRPYEFIDWVQVSVSYELELDKYFEGREVYTFLDWLGDVGGLSSALFTLGGLIMILIAGNGLDYMLFSNMFKVEGDE